MPHPITLSSPLPAEDLLFESMSDSAGLSQLGEMRLGLLSPKSSLQPEDLLGKTVCVTVQVSDDHKRFFHGHVTRFGIGAHRGRYYGYQATVRPWLWFLTRTADCRIFQELTVPDIVKKVFEDHGVANFEFRLFRSYRTWNYCVQYRESDYQFIARLLEHEGIYWYFEHTSDAHKLVLVDSQSAHNTVPGCESLPFYTHGTGAPPDTACITAWHFAREIQTGKSSATSYDFERPSANLAVGVDQIRHHDQADLELYDFQGDYTVTDDGEQWAGNRLDAMQSAYDQLRGNSNSLAISAGHLLKMTRHPRDDQNAEMLVTRTQMRAHQATAESDGEHSFACEFWSMPSSQQYRPPRRTPKPFMQGPQTAVVCGPDGEEIFTDKFGRVKVQFHWDRLGKKNEKSSCWVRVSSPWAGKSFGFIQIPRIGQEVVVDFLEGDPDQPLITGRVYNAEQMPPWALPDNATQSGILTRSSKGGAYGNANALRFEDKKGAEQVWMHAERDYSKTVENNDSSVINGNRTATVLKHDSLSIKKGREMTIEADGETLKITGLRKKVLTGHEREEISDGKDTIITGEYGEYTTGARKSWTSAAYTFKSTGAFFDGGPEFYATAGTVKHKATGDTFSHSGGDFNAHATNFRFAASSDFHFFGNNFNRTIFQGNDTVLGPNTNCYIGSARNTAMGQSSDVYMGMQNSATMGVSISGFVGLQIENVAAIAMSNSVMALQNQGLSIGMTGINLSQNSMEVDNNALTILNAGGGAGGAGAAAAPVTANAAAIASLLGGAFALGAGAAGGAIAAYQGNMDVQALLNNPALTPAVRARLARTVANGGFWTGTPEGYGEGISAGEQADQTARLASGWNNPDTGAHEGGVPSAPQGEPPNPFAGLDGPPAEPPANP